jgi:predicted nucleic acid-binding protein
VIAIDTSVLVRYLVGTPAAEAGAAARLIDDAGEVIGISPVVLVETTHVLRTQYGIARERVLDELIGVIQRENVQILCSRTEPVLEMLVRARSLPGHPIPDALIVAAAVGNDATVLATFDRGQTRYGFPAVRPGSTPRGSLSK